jgi:hypothetical protein
LQPLGVTDMPANTYRSYLLRMWKEVPGDDYRASLQDIITSECHNFSTLAALINFLRSKNEPCEFPVESRFEVEMSELNL